MAKRLSPLVPVVSMMFLGVLFLYNNNSVVSETNKGSANTEML